ncbi:MAG: choice-of-anchor D domain-containing protein [Dysgonamonadaceae bacterium]|jgi:hypothetical protein|nr:choice-of-anchor D domain-containing protein [Dysgonamonadaceae bacterium]
MKAIVLKKRKNILTGVFLLFLCCAPFLGNAQRLLTEDFNYPAGNLYGQGGEGTAGWVKYGSHAEAPIQVVSPSLTYSGYQDQAMGNAVELNATVGGQDLKRKFSDEGTGNSTVYVSFLANFKSVGKESNPEATAEAYFFNFVEKTTAAYSDGSSGNAYAGIFVKEGSIAGKIKIGVSRSNYTAAYNAVDEYNLNETYLIIAKYEVIEGNTNDKVSLFINAVGTEPATPNAIYEAQSGTDANVNRGLAAVELNQAASAFPRHSPHVIIDAIRVSTTWAGLFDSQTPPVPVPALTLSPAIAAFGAITIGESPSKTILVKGENLEGDITITGVPAELEPGTTTITKAQAEAAGGYNLTLTLTPVNETMTSATLLFDSEGLTQKTLPVTWTATQPVVTPPDGGLVDNSGFEEWGSGFPGEKPVDWDTQNGITKEPVIKKSGNYAVKITGGSNVLLGQTLTNPSPAFVRGDVYELIINYHVVASAGNYNDVQLACAWGGGNVDASHDEDKLKTDLTSAAGTWATEAIRTSVPKNATSFAIQIKVPANAVVIFDDISFKNTGSKEPYMDITPQSLPEVSTTVNAPVDMQKLTITTGNLPSAVAIAVTGANSSYFTSSATSIPAAQTTTELTITYRPATTGAHTAVLSFDCTGATAINKTVSLKGKAIDPSNPASITADPVSLSFTTEVGKKDTLEVTVTTANLDDWPLARIVGEGPGFFTYSGGPVKNGTNTVKVIFAPTAEGTFSKRLEIYAAGAVSAFVDLSGTATGSLTEPEKEGDSYPLDLSNPVALLEETFDTGVHNRALSLSGWKNIAEQNYRAWWGYRFEDNNFAAKVTAFNSINTAPDPYEMWLITPPLDFIQSVSKIFTFRVMGDLILENSDASLELYYMDAEDAEDVYKVKIDGLDIPDSPDFNGEWREYRIDLTGQELADVFFMGFRFSALGGTQNSVVYYIDDVTYGKDFTSVAGFAKNNKVWTENQTIQVRSGEKGNAVLYDATGTKLGEYPIEAGGSELRPMLKRGIYILKIQYAGYTESYKVIL